jgi:hypothetical protein
VKIAVIENAKSADHARTINSVNKVRVNSVSKTRVSATSKVATGKIVVDAIAVAVVVDVMVAMKDHKVTTVMTLVSRTKTSALIQ